jgi:cytochrome c-type biogenesis protein
MGATFAGIAESGPLVAALAVAALAGLASFLSPCVLPLVPGYLSYVTGLAGADLDSGQRRGRVLAGTGLFITGFAAVFVAVSVVAARAAFALIAHRRLLEVVGGLLVIVLGLAFIGLVPGLQREWRIHRLPDAGLAGAPVFGAVFALSWTPCLGPTLSAVLSLGFQQATAGRGALLGVAYCLGLGIPFVLVALGARWALGATSFLRRHARTVTRAGGAVLVVVGLMLLTGAWTDLMEWLRSWLATTGLGESSV